MFTGLFKKINVTRFMANRVITCCGFFRVLSKNLGFPGNL